MNWSTRMREEVDFISKSLLDMDMVPLLVSQVVKTLGGHFRTLVFAVRFLCLERIQLRCR